LNGSFAFVGIESLTGGTAADSFVFSDGAKVAGSVDGGGDSNTADYSAYTTILLVDLALGIGTGVGGTGSNIDNVFDGSGNDVLVGNSRANFFAAGLGRNLLIGEGGTDTLFGASGDDILIGGSTIYDTNIAALLAIMREWTRSDRSYQQRVADLQFGTGL